MCSNEYKVMSFTVDVSGGFSDWTDWSVCDGGCIHNDSVIRRNRLCDNPVPSGSGAPCSGHSFEELNYGT